MSIKNLQFGLVSEVTADAGTLLQDRGVLGLGYGSENILQNKNANAQVPPKGWNANPALNNKLNLLGLLSSQNKGIVTAPNFAIKLEDSLNVVNFGVSEAYFSSDAGNSYDNQGTQFW